jgi:hypothetical protein
MITVDLDLGQSDWTEKDWVELDSRMRAIRRMFKIKDIFDHE